MIPPATAVADVLQLRGGTGWLSPPLHPMTGSPAALGRARTVRLAPGPGGLGPLRDILAEDLNGRVLVIAGAAHAAGAVWGEILSVAARDRGALAALVDGAVRDVASLALPTWARSRATAGPGNVHVAETGARVEIAGVPVDEDDRVLLDETGAVALGGDPDDLLAAATAYAEAEERTLAALRAGESLPTAYTHKSAAIADLGRRWA